MVCLRLFGLFGHKFVGTDVGSIVRQSVYTVTVSRVLPGNVDICLSYAQSCCRVGTEIETVLVGFAAETDDLLANAGEKLRRKNLDWIVANDIGRTDRGFGSPDNAVVMLGRGGERFDFDLAPKLEIARRILAVLSGPVQSR